MCNLLEANDSTSEKGLIDIVSKYGVSSSVTSAMEDLGLFSDHEMVPLFETPCDTLSAALAQKYTFSELQPFYNLKRVAT